MSKQPEALRLADLLEPCCLTIGDAQQAVAAAELRRLHAENEQITKYADALNDRCIRDTSLIGDLLAVLKELQLSASYWSEYDVPLGIVERINAAIAKAEAST